MKIVSLLPSATEIVFALGLGDELAAVTEECDYPAEVTTSRSSRGARCPRRGNARARSTRPCANGWTSRSRSTGSTST